MFQRAFDRKEEPVFVCEKIIVRGKHILLALFIVASLAAIYLFLFHKTPEIKWRSIDLVDVQEIVESHLWMRDKDGIEWRFKSYNDDYAKYVKELEDNQLNSHVSFKYSGDDLLCFLDGSGERCFTSVEER